MSIEPQLGALERAELIRLAQSFPEAEYLFRHALVQEAAYGSLLKTARRDLHHAIGETMERLYPERLDDLAPELARHFAEAEQYDLAIRYFARAGERAAARYANAEAVMHFDSLLALAAERALPAGLSRERVSLLRGRALEMLGRYADADANYVAMERLATARGDRALELAAVNARGTIYSAPTSLHDDAMARTLGERAIALARSLGDRAAESKALWNLSLAHRFAGDSEAALSAAEGSIAIARALNLREQLAFTLNDASAVLAMRGDMAGAHGAVREAIDLFRALGNLPMLCDSLNNLAEIEWAMGHTSSAQALSEEALGIARAIGNQWGEGFSTAHLAMLALERADFGAALRGLDSTIALARASGFAIGEQIALALGAQAYGRLGDYAHMQERLDRLEATAIAGYGGIPRSARLALQSLALAGLGEIERARAIAQEAETDLVHFDAQMGAVLHVTLARAWFLIGDLERALAKSLELKDFIERYAMRNVLPDALCCEAAAMLALGRPEEGHALLVQARAESLALGSRSGQFAAGLALAPLARRLGKPDAEALMAEARDLTTYVAEHAPSESRQAFLEQPAVQALLA